MDRDLMIGKHFTFMQEINEANLPKAFKGAACLELAVQREFDIHAIDESRAEDHANMVNQFHPGKGRWMVLPKTEHAFATVPSMAQHVQMRNRGEINNAYLSRHCNPELHRVATGWIHEILQKANETK